MLFTIYFIETTCCNQDGIIVENMHDIPYVKGPVGSEIIAAMTRICSDVKQILPNIPCGLQVYLLNETGKILFINRCTYQFRY